MSVSGDKVFTIQEFEINVTELNKPIYLIPFGDIHRFAPLCDVSKWVEFLNWAKNKPNAYYLGMGDYDDLASSSERRALDVACLHESTQQTLDDIFTDRANRLASELAFMKNNLLGLIEGNHFGELLSGVTTTQLMCQKLNCKYLGVSSFIRLSFKYGSKRSCIHVWAHHGRGASRLVGGSLNSVEQMIKIADSDIYLMGHDHRKGVSMLTKLVLQGARKLALSRKKILLGRTGSFLKGYEPGEPSYIVGAAMSPTDLGVLKIELTPKRSRASIVDIDCIKGKRRSDIFYIDIHASV